ncbi:hypothetical protein LMG28614_00648 [Paraburkholderia ultramafica]|uniref:DUF2894 domain-containing protein n=1 Tax=Paraburkholderia ultramafica TaxID=1544867 RepID=A0A6S7CE83_9BURK|nr:DUF2894 domain-containing protein [Paraburkholderia ultramafica]CAB3778554.1 hypothetical protein LMG28614_00648 [Paraburkholderia ultramafica]
MRSNDSGDNGDSGDTRVTSEARATLDAWRERGADRLDPVRFHFIAALERRAATHSGEARRVLDDRLSALLDAYAADLERATAAVAEADAVALTSASREPAHETLAGLIDHIARRMPADRDGAASYPELPALDYFREVWSKVRAEKQLRQSLAQVPGNAGPLNSSSLVHRSLSLMRELSPGYLKQFLSYVDTLAWMEQLNGGGAPTGKEAPRAGTASKGARSKARQDASAAPFRLR